MTNVAQYERDFQKQRGLEQELYQLMQVREQQLVEIRALSPVFSPLAFAEARELFESRQKVHAGIQKQVWRCRSLSSTQFSDHGCMSCNAQMFWWDMLFEGIAGSRSDSLAEVLVGAIIRFM